SREWPQEIRSQSQPRRPWVQRFNLGRSRLSLLLEGQINQRKHNHRSNDYDGGVQQDMLSTTVIPGVVWIGMVPANAAPPSMSGIGKTNIKVGTVKHVGYWRR